MNKRTPTASVAHNTPETTNAQDQDQTSATAVPSPTGTLPTPRRPKAKWSWTLVNFSLDCTLLVVFLSLIWVTTVIRFIFPPASAAQGWLLWGYNIDVWMEWQFALTAIFAFGILVHLMLHWSWVCGVFFTRVWRRKGAISLPDDGTRTIYGVGLMIVVLNLLGLLTAAAVLSMRPPS